MSKKIDLHFEKDGKKIRFFNHIDSEALEFESKLRQQKRLIPQSDLKELPIEISLQQSCDWLAHSNQEFWLLQVSNAEGRAIGQIATLVHRPRRLKWFPTACVPSFGSSFITKEEETWALELVASLLEKHTEVTKLRIQAYRPHQRDLYDFEGLARRAGYKIVDPMGVTRTLVFELTPTLDELFASFDQKTRAKIRHSSREKIEIVRISDRKWIPTMQDALKAAFSRTGSYSGIFDFEPFFKLQDAKPEQVLILGLFLKDHPEELLAYSIDVRHGHMVEAVSSGSLPNQELRKLNFNYFLFWEKVKWARDGVSTLLDLGGVTDGTTSDPLAGVSFFKRHLTRKEIEVGREMERIIRPGRARIFNTLVQVREAAQR